MFSEYEVQTFYEIPEVKEATHELKRKFITKEAKFLEISDQDFLSLVLMTPAVGIANANNNISLFEEIALNKMARKMSRGGYFLKADPVERGMKFLIKDYDEWEKPFLKLIELVMSKTFDKSAISSTISDGKEPTMEDFSLELMHVPFILVRYLSSFFLQGETEIMEPHKISRVEYDKVLYLAKCLKIDELQVFKAFCATFIIK